MAGRYATALYSASYKQHAQDKVLQEIKVLHQSLSKDPKLTQLFTNPTINRVQKRQLVETAFKSPPYSQTFVNFLILLAENGRLDCFSEISAFFLEMMKVTKKQLDIVLTSAIELDEDQLRRIEGLVREKFVVDGQMATFKSQVDGSLMGGFVVEVGDKTVDLSGALQMVELEKDIFLS